MASADGAAAPTDTGAAAPSDDPYVHQTRPAQPKCQQHMVMLGNAVRGLSAACGLGMTVVSVFGFSSVNDVYNKTCDGSDTLAGETTYPQLGIFLYIALLYFVFGGLLVFAAEVRTRRLKMSVLKYFGFLLSYTGRGFCYILLGLLFGVFSELAAKVVGGVTVACGLLQLTLACSLPPDKDGGALVWQPKASAAAATGGTAAAGADKPAADDTSPFDQQPVYDPAFSGGDGSASGGADAAASATRPGDSPTPARGGGGDGGGGGGDADTPGGDSVSGNPFLSM